MTQEQPNQSSAPVEQQLKEFARWQMHVDTTDQKPSDTGITPEDVAYSMWLEENAQNPGSTSSKLGESSRSNEDGARKERLRSMARLGMRVKTGMATGEEAAQYYGMMDEETEEDSSHTALAANVEETVDVPSWINGGTEDVADAEDGEGREVDTPEQASETLYRLRSGMNEVYEHGEDRSLGDNGTGLFAVFDGAGGAGGNPAAAANAAAESFFSVWENSRFDDEYADYEEAKQEMRNAFDSARENVNEKGEGGITTAVVAKFIKINGEPHLVWGNAGDSRLFVYHKDTKTYEPVSTEQAHPMERNVILNYMGDGKSSVGDEFGIMPVGPNDRIMLCSDGITGDWGPNNDYDMPNQLLSDGEMLEAFSCSLAEEAAQRFTELSKKRDDKTVLVIDIDELS